MKSTAFFRVVTAAALAAGTYSVAQAYPASPAFVPNEIIVQFRDTASDAEKNDALARVAGGRRANLDVAAHNAGRSPGLVLAGTPATVPQAIAILSRHPAVEYAEPNWVYTHHAVPTDSYFTGGTLWGMYGDASSPANAYGSQAAEAWGNGHTGSASVYVGVIDEGIQFDHPDLAGQIWTNPYDPVDGVDNDGNGYIDDVHGWDFNGNDNTIYDGGTRGRSDDHGTHVSGTIGARANNGGVVGVNWNVTIISGKFLGTRGGTTANAVLAVKYFTDLKTRHGLNLVALNNSWGGGGFSQSLLDAIVGAAKQNILFIASAGNGGSDGVGDNNDTTATYPANYNTTKDAGYDSVIAVAAITSSGAKASFSNYGPTTVEIGAPGSGIYSTTAYNTYSNYSGTSMAAPHVTGAAALYASTHSGATAQDIRNAILGSAAATSSLSGKTITGGRLNVSDF